jgi:pimeloyl-ACP methyl ester carboxylesterase
MAAHEPPPYVLVGHSWGGWLITVYAHNHLENVGGIVLVDSSVGFDPPVIEKMPEAQVGGPPAGPMVAKRNSNEDDPFKKLPVRAAKDYQWTQSLRPLDSKPLALIAARRAGEMGEDTEKGKTIRSKVLGLSRDSAVVYAKSGHRVQLDEPNTVVATVRQIVERTCRGAKNPNGHSDL